MPYLKGSAFMARQATKRRDGAEQRRQAVLDAALDVFAKHGFAAARLDDVAEKAGVAKGTIYLSFKDKEDLFEHILIAAVAPVIAKAEALAAAPAMPFDQLLSTLFDFFREEVLGTRRREIVRLVLTEGHRFPRIAGTYHREVVSKGLEIIRRFVREAHKRGELASDELVRFPQLVFAPMLLALIWNGLFEKHEHLDTNGLFAAHRELLTQSVRHKPRKA
jgi:AcrR family transcriptional regulator